MVKILHISDPHFETETMRRLENLAHSYNNCDVLALTGDCTSGSKKQLPQEWNDWPQRLKLSVPGNHDEADTFNLLDKWFCLAKWEYGKERHIPLAFRLQDLIFIGIDTSADNKPYSEIHSDLQKLNQEYRKRGSGVVILTHKWPSLNEADWLGGVLSEFVGNRKLLVLHGHKHPSTSKGSEWEASAKIGMLSYYRSKAISCKNPKRGRGHLIAWEHEQFTCSEVQGRR